MKNILIDLPNIVDARGSLCVAENNDLPFEVKRVFWIYDVQEGETRGGHSHLTCEEVVFPVCGRFEMVVDDGKERLVYEMDSPTKGIYIKKGVWCELRNFAPGTVCVVLASEPYRAEGYVY